MKSLFVVIVSAAISVAALSARADIVKEGITPTTPQPEGPPPTVSESHHKGLGIMFEAAYGVSSESPSAMNSALTDFQWSGGVIAAGEINSLQYLAIGAGYRIFDRFHILLRYEQSQQVQGPVLISQTTYSVSNGFYYYPLYLLLEGDIYRRGGFYISGLGGVGYALKYELHQTENPGEDITWQANPMAYRLGSNLGYAFASNFDLFADVFYESVTSKLKAAQSYTSKSIQQGQYFTDQTTGAAADANLSGLRYGLGVRLRF